MLQFNTKDSMEQVREYPKWVNGTLCKDAEDEAALAPDKPGGDTLEGMKGKGLKAYAADNGIVIPDDVTSVKDIRAFLIAFRDAE